MAEGKVPGKGYCWEIGTCLGRGQYENRFWSSICKYSPFLCFCLQYPLLKDTGTPLQ